MLFVMILTCRMCCTQLQPGQAVEPSIVLGHSLSVSAHAHTIMRTQVSVYLPNHTGELDVHLSGKYEACKDGLDCVAIFDGSSFSLELLHGHIMTR